MARLEREMLEIPEIRESLQSRISTEAKLRTGDELAKFFYGVDLRGAADPRVQSLRADLRGLRQFFGMLVEQLNDNSSDGGGRTYYDRGFQPLNFFNYFYPVEGHPFVLMHAFRLIDAPKAERGSYGFSEHFSGYAFPLWNGQTHCLMKHEGPPGHVEYWAFWRVPDEDDYNTGVPPIGQAYRYDMMPSYVIVDGVNYATLGTFRGDMKYSGPVDPIVSKGLIVHLEKIKWNIKR